MLQWLWKQKMRIDKGYQMAAGLNTLLLLAQSDKLAHFCGLNLPAFIVIAVPVIIGGIWLCGYVMTSPAVQAAEDEATAELSPGRRDTAEILRLLKVQK